MKTNLTIKILTVKAIIITGIFFITPACRNKHAHKAEIVIDSTEVKFINTATKFDSEFLVNIAEMNLEQIILGTLAKEKGTVTIVKELGDSIKEYHQTALIELTELAKEKMITIPTAVTDKGNEDHKNLNINTGTDFDKAYANMMVNMHNNAIILFESASNESTDLHIKKWVQEELANLHQLHELAKTCQEKVDKAK